MVLAASVPVVLAGPAAGQGMKARPSPVEAAGSRHAEVLRGHVLMLRMILTAAPGELSE